MKTRRNSVNDTCTRRLEIIRQEDTIPKERQKVIEGEKKRESERASVETRDTMVVVNNAADNRSRVPRNGSSLIIV